MNERSPKTTQIYDRAIKQVLNGKEMTHLLNHSTVIEWIEAQDKSKNSKKIYYIAIVSRLKTLGDKSFDEALKAYKAKMDSYNAEQKLIAQKQELSEVEVAKWVDWGQVLIARETYRQLVRDVMSFQDYLIMCLYTMQAPVRADYAFMRIVDSEPQDVSGNYLMLLSKRAEFIINEYKTAHKYGAQRIPVTKELFKVLKEWVELAGNPEYLLVDKRGSPMKENVLSATVIRIMKEATGKPAGISTLRHSYITHMRRGEKPLMIQNAVASAMMHSISMSQLYRKIKINF